MRHRWQALFHRSEWESNLNDELQGHVDNRAEDLMRRGLTPAEAVRQARMELGSREAYKEQCREEHGLRWPDEIKQDMLYAARLLRRSPGFIAVAVLSLALGIGANTVVFSAINVLLLKPLPVASPGELRFVERDHFPWHYYSRYLDMRDRNQTFSGLIGYEFVGVGIETGGFADWAPAYLATGNYFDVLGARPRLGRFFGPEDDLKSGAKPVVVLSYAYWRKRFAEDPRILGRAIRVNSLPYTVVGVAPDGFYGTELYYRPEIWIPMRMQPQVEGFSVLDNYDRGPTKTMIIGRLKPGITVRQAEADLGGIAAASRQGAVAFHGDWNRINLTQPGLIGDLFRRPVEAFTSGVMVLSGMVLLAACFNLASLLAARAIDRRHELAIRSSIGAGRARIVRQLLSEAVLVSILGGAAGCVLAFLLVRALSAWRISTGFTVQVDGHPDWRVIAFAAAAALFTGILSGIVPAQQAWAGRDPRPVSSAAGVRGRGRLRDVILPIQIALCCAVLTASLVSFRGLSRSLQTPLGFDPRGVAVASTDLTCARYRPEDGRAFQRRVVEELSRVPGVKAAAYANRLPLSTNNSLSVYFAEDATDFSPSHGKIAGNYSVSPDYFRTIGTRIIAGRDFAWRDGTWRDGAQTIQRAIVNVTFARTVLHSREAIGRRFRFRQQGPPAEVIGIVEDGKYVALTEIPLPVVFWPAAQEYDSAMVLLVRSSGPEQAAATRIREVVGGLDPRLPLYGVGSLTDFIGLVYLPARIATTALCAFGLLAAMLAVTGMHGMAQHAVSGRIREIGIRVAVGAGPWQVLRPLLLRTALELAIGSCAGLVLGLAADRVLASIVYKASARDPVVLAGAALGMVLIGFAATWAPARRALSIDPLIALRHE
jgi:predicted permease